MLSKEEIEKAKECLQETIQNTYAEGKAIKLNNVLKYIDQLESDKQKLIEKLEEDIKNKEELIKLEYEGYKEYYARTGGYPNQMKFNVFKLTGEKNKAEEILSILKEENQVTVK